MLKTVILTKLAQKQLRRVPVQVAAKLRLWVNAVETEGLESVRMIPGYHDEPLRGARRGQRSIRLNRQYRAIYAQKISGELEFVCVEEVSAHDY